MTHKKAKVEGDMGEGAAQEEKEKDTGHHKEEKVKVEGYMGECGAQEAEKNADFEAKPEEFLRTCCAFLDRETYEMYFPSTKSAATKTLPVVNFFVLGVEQTGWALIGVSEEDLPFSRMFLFNLETGLTGQELPDIPIYDFAASQGSTRGDVSVVLKQQSIDCVLMFRHHSPQSFWVAKCIFIHSNYSLPFDCYYYPTATKFAHRDCYWVDWKLCHVYVLEGWHRKQQGEICVERFHEPNRLSGIDTLSMLEVDKKGYLLTLCNNSIVIYHIMTLESVKHQGVFQLMLIRELDFDDISICASAFGSGFGLVRGREEGILYFSAWGLGDVWEATYNKQDRVWELSQMLVRCPYTERESEVCSCLNYWFTAKETLPEIKSNAVMGSCAYAASTH